MEIKKMTFGLLLIITVAISACGGTSAPAAKTEPQTAAKETMAEKEVMAEEATAEKTPTEEAMMEDKASQEVMADKEITEKVPTEEVMMDRAATEEALMEDQGSEEAMAAKALTEEVMMAKEVAEEAMMKEATEEAMAEKPADEAMAAPAWFNAELTDVNSGETFKIADFKGKVVLVETMAVWCPTCLRQQGQMRALHELLGERDDLVSLSLDIDPNEDTEILKEHVTKNGFDWRYAVAPPEVAREIGQLYGAQFLNPPSAPILIVDRTGEVHPLPFGLKDAPTLQEALAPFMNEG